MDNGDDKVGPGEEETHGVHRQFDTILKFLAS